MTLHELSTGVSFQWQESAGVSLPHISTGTHLMVPQAPGVVYAVLRKGVEGEVKTLMHWGGSGAPRELLRVTSAEQFTLAGWQNDGVTLLITRWRLPANDPSGTTPIRTLWRVPIAGGVPAPTHLAMEALRDISFHPDGRQIAFNAGFKKNEHWVMENLLR